MECRVCSQKTKEIFTATLMHKYQVAYFHCGKCGFLSTEEPYWLDEAYSSPISKFDTGHMLRNIRMSELTTILLKVFFNSNGKFVDYAGGNGVFVRMMRDIGFDFYWEDKYAQNLFSVGFEWENDCSTDVEAVTTFESFEHFVEPMQEIKKLLSISESIIFTTELLPGPIPTPNEWWYYTLERGAHISFYSEKTFRYISNQYGLRYFHLNDFHVMTKKDNITDARLRVLLLNKFGLSRILSRLIKSKTWEDYNYIKAISNRKE